MVNLDRKYEIIRDIDNEFLHRNVEISVCNGYIQLKELIVALKRNLNKAMSNSMK